VHWAVLRIRTMAYLREPMLDDCFPGADYPEQIRLLADLCDVLVPGLVSDPDAALQHAYRSRRPQREWMIETLACDGIDLLDLVDSEAEE
jgi:hypothetical protein